MAKSKTKRDPWFRRQGEPDIAWEAFQNYRNQRPPRRAFSVARDGSKMDVTKIARWFKTFRWEERVAAWDEYCADMYAQHEEAEHLQILAEARDLASYEISKLLKASRDSDKPTARIVDVNSLLDKVVKLSKLIRGETVEPEEEISLSGLDDSELDAIQTILNRDAS